MRLLHLLILYFFFNFPSFSQSASDTTLPIVNKERLRGIIFAEISGYTSSMIGLNALWYSDFQKSKFHLFNDTREWLQVDKAGHAMTSYYIGKLGMDALKWGGISDKKALWYGGTLGFAFLTTVEVFDGFSAQWGASAGDVAANAAGFALLFAQETLWKEQRILLKFSFTPSKMARYRPEILGRNFQEQMLKDYNGQTYWLSINPASFLKHQAKIPAWLSLSIGYGAEGMTGGRVNLQNDEKGNLIPDFSRKRQYYISADLDLSKIKTRSAFLNTIFKSISFIKFPAPALEFSGKQVKLHPLYF